MAGKMCTGAVTNNSYLPKESKAFSEGVHYRAGGTLAGRPVTDNPHVATTSAGVAWIAGWTVADDVAPAGTIDQTEVWLEVKALDVNLSICKLDYLNDFIGEDMGCDDNLPTEFLTYLLGQIGASVADALEITVWQGTVATAGEFDGFEVKLDAGAGATAGAVELTSANIIAETRKMLAANASFAELVGKSDAYIYMSSKNYNLFVQANNDKGNASPCGEDCQSLDGFQVVLAPGKSAGRMAFAQKSNMHFGTWSTSDQTSVSVIDMSAFGEKNLRFTMCFFGGTAIGVPTEASYYVEVVAP